VWVSNAGGEFEYGAQRGGGSWIWVGGNGKFTVPAGALAPIVATGLVIAPFGTVDFRLEIDVSGDGANLNALFQGLDYSGKVKVKGSAWGWSEIALSDDGMKGDSTADDGVYTFVLSENIGKHDGLLKLGAMPEFIFVLDGVEYKNTRRRGCSGRGQRLQRLWRRGCRCLRRGRGGVCRGSHRRGRQQEHDGDGRCRLIPDV